MRTIDSDLRIIFALRRPREPPEKSEPVSHLEIQNERLMNLCQENVPFRRILWEKILESNHFE